MSRDDLTARIRKVLTDHGRLSQSADALQPETDLYAAGLTSHASVSVMLALEGEFDIEFPDQMLSRGVFGSIAAIQAALEKLSAS